MTKYNKSNFFDEISTSTSERVRETLEERNMKKKMDMETFGEDFFKKGTKL